jgi:formylglycine-generating enzyme required for sulfatase activity
MPQSQRADPINIRIGDIAARVRRGGFWSGEKPFYFSCTCRDWVRANYAGEKMGFRCVIPDAQGR